MALHVPNKHRIRSGPLTSDDSFGNAGAFMFDSKIPGRRLLILCSDEYGWEHVSVSAQQGQTPRTPTWEEMAQVKNMFWEDEDTVMQLHPPKSEYVNNHQNVLHLWRPLESEIPLPPSVLVGIKELNPPEEKN